MENLADHKPLARDALNVRGPAVAASESRFIATYRLRCSASDVAGLTSALCHEHTVELSPSLIGSGYLARNVVGEAGVVTQLGNDLYECEIHYPEAAAEGGLTTLLTLVMGNAGFFPEVELTGLTLSAGLRRAFKGPRIGVKGLRDTLRRGNGPLVGTALKPLGASARELAVIAGQMAEGGIEILKEDDGISTQPYAPFAERVTRCAEAVRNASVRTNGVCLYFPNITGPQETLIDRAMMAQEAGAGGVELLPGPMGLDSVRMLADLPELTIPVATHSAWTGAMCRPPNAALSFAVAFGLLPRLAGADISIMPGFGGRFALPPDACREAAEMLGDPMEGFHPAFPMVGGGLNMAGIGEYVSVYGDNVVLLISGALFAGEGSLVENCRAFGRHARSSAGAAG